MSNNPTSNNTHSIASDAVIQWPTKPSILDDTGVLGQPGDGSNDNRLPDCPACHLYMDCPGFRPLDPNASAPPCKTYSSYSEWRDTIKIGGSNEQTETEKDFIH